jgi:hypothetical protein
MVANPPGSAVAECDADQLTVTELLKDIGNDPRIEQPTSAVGRLRGLECGGLSSP